MEKGYLYRNMITKEIVFDDDVIFYISEKLGLKIEPIGENRTWTEEQLIVLDMLEDWYFSGEWNKYDEKSEVYRETLRIVE